MIEHIDHIGIKVTDLPAVCRAFEEMGVPCNHIEQYDEVGMRIAFLGDRESRLELLEVTDPSSPIVDDKPGLHHLGLAVKDIEETYSTMKQSNRFTVQGNIRQGAHSRIFFFKIAGQEDVLYECVELQATTKEA
jgi:methylmalonyl-CoA epimerase